MKTFYRISFFFLTCALLITWAGDPNAGRMEAGPSLEQRSGTREGSGAGPGSWITLEPSMVNAIARNNTFLKRQAPRIRAGLRDLKQSGVLDHEGIMAIENTMTRAQTNMARLLAAGQSGRLASTKAASIADDLISQAETLENFIEDIDGGSSSAMGPQGTIDKQEPVLQALSAISRMLYNTGKAIGRCVDR